MSASDKVPNLTIRRIREIELQETRSQFADALAQKAAEMSESVSPSERYVARLEDGDIRFPQPAYRRVLSQLCGRPISELGFEPERLSGTDSDGYPFVVPLRLREIESIRRARAFYKELGFNTVDTKRFYRTEL